MTMTRGWREMLTVGIGQKKAKSPRDNGRLPLVPKSVGTTPRPAPSAKLALKPRSGGVTLIRGGRRISEDVSGAVQRQVRHRRREKVLVLVLIIILSDALRGGAGGYIQLLVTTSYRLKDYLKIYSPFEHGDPIFNIRRMRRRRKAGKESRKAGTGAPVMSGTEA
ncbi:hypothetical protein B0H16DRAFT_1758702 [Mycena metata]|uniref:Uncharacterized protein n=1 Tax=Mycena metata TaxID=1033252 RepID=A0AAD7IBQ9_9AGAR|nr:hypothetical protein B0H16DRAFT_1758702 [Mycena metata]